jgi:hypothetical protein
VLSASNSLQGYDRTLSVQNKCLPGHDKKHGVQLLQLLDLFDLICRIALVARFERWQHKPAAQAMTWLPG